MYWIKLSDDYINLAYVSMVSNTDGCLRLIFHPFSYGDTSRDYVVADDEDIATVLKHLGTLTDHAFD